MTKECKHPKRAIRSEMLRDTCALCGAVRVIRPDPMIGRIESPWGVSSEEDDDEPNEFDPEPNDFGDQ
jgi:hypothetical protein